MIIQLRIFLLLFIICLAGSVTIVYGSSDPAWKTAEYVAGPFYLKNNYTGFGSPYTHMYLYDDNSNGTFPEANTSPSTSDATSYSSMARCARKYHGTDASAFSNTDAYKWVIERRTINSVNYYFIRNCATLRYFHTGAYGDYYSQDMDNNSLNLYAWNSTLIGSATEIDGSSESEKELSYYCFALASYSSSANFTSTIINKRWVWGDRPLHSEMTNSHTTAPRPEYVFFTNNANVWGTKSWDFNIVQTTPSVTSSAASSVAGTTATMNGNVTFAGSHIASVTGRGFKWSTSNGFDPASTGTTVTAGSGTGSFSGNLTGLSAGVTYYYYAYATNSSGTDYGTQQSFTTTGTPFTSAQAGDWNTGSTWTGGVVPSAGASITLNHDVTVNSAVSNAIGSINVATSKTLTFGGGTLTTGSMTVTGTLTMTTGTLTISSGGTFANNGTFNSGGGTVAFAGSGTISGTASFNAVTIAGAVNFGAASTITGSLTINNGGSVLTNAPIYSCPSTLIINTTGNRSRSTEWGAVTSGAGYPCNVQISNSTTFDVGAGGAATTAQIAGNLTIDNSCVFTLDGGTKRTAAVKILGNVTVGGGASGTMTLSTSSGGDLEIGGNLTRGVGSTWTNNGRNVTFNGSSTQTISYTGGGTQQLEYCIIDKSAGNLILSSSPATNVQIQSTSGNVFQILNSGGLDLNGQTFTVGCSGGCYGGNILVSGGARTITSAIAGGVFRIEGNSFGNLSKTVTSAGGGTLVVSSNAILAIKNCDFDPGSGLTTINSEADIEVGGDFITNGPTYGSSSNLVFKTGFNFNLTHGGGQQKAWITGTSGTGVPYNVIVDGASVAGSGITAAAGVGYTARGNLSITGNGTVTLSATNAPGNTLKVAGNWTASATSTFTPNTNMVTFNGSSAQTLTKTGGTETFYDLEIANTSGDLTLAASTSVTLTHRLTFTSGNIIIVNNDFIYNLGSIADAPNTTQGTPSATCKIVTNGTGKVTIKSFTGTNSFIFQIGPSTTTYNRATWESASSGHTTDDLSARVEIGLPSDIVNTPGFVNRTWYLTEGSTGGSNGDLNLYWITGDENASFTTHRVNGRVFHKPAASWVLEPNTNLTALDNNSSNMPATGWRCRTGAITSFSPFIVGYETALPVELLSFTGSKNKDGNLLKWKTATETNNDYFTLERSYDGVNFIIIQKQKGIGNSTQENNYSFLDAEVTDIDKPVYYRLKQTDFDGQFSSYSTIVIDGNKGSKLNIRTLYIDNNNLLLNMESSPVTVEVVDALGKLIRSDFVPDANGLVNIQIPENLAHQILMVRIFNQRDCMVKKIIY